jgi:hypothetical protein
VDEERATDMFFSSSTFSQLADASTGLHEKPWTEIYELLKTELSEGRKP